MYGTTADALTYHAARGNDAWVALTPADQGVYLQRGSDYIDRAYRNRFPGTKAGGAAQFEEWPRQQATYRTGEAIDSATVPTAVEYAAYEAALIEAKKPGTLMPTYSEDTRKTSVRAGSVEVRYQDIPRGSAGGKPMNRATVPFEVAEGYSRSTVVTPTIDGLLSGILRPAFVPGAITA